MSPWAIVAVHKPVGFSTPPPSSNTMVDSTKHTDFVKVWLTERELLDLSKLAAREDRKLSEMGRVILRRFMYGTVSQLHDDCNEAMRNEKDRQ